MISQKSGIRAKRRAHFMSRDELILATVIVNVFDVSRIAIRNDKYLDGQKRSST